MVDHLNGFFSNLDPEENYFDQLFPSIGSSEQSKYYTLSEFNLLMSQNQLPTTILTYNIRSFNCNSNYFFASFENNSLPEILVFSETWFNNSNVTEIPGYKSFHTFRTGRSGGVSIFVKNNFLSHKLEEISYASSDIEICSVDVVMGGASWCLLGIYRPVNGNQESFMHEIENILQNNSALRNRKILILGDININLLLQNSMVDEFSANMLSRHFIPTITKPTRFSADDSQNPSLIDHIWLNSPQAYTSGIILSDLTDHSPVFIRLNLNPCLRDRSGGEIVRVSFRPNTEENRTRFMRAVADFNWRSLFSNDVDDYMRNFIDKLNCIYSECFPLKTKNVPQRRLDNPWLTQRIHKLLKLKSSYFKLLKLGLITKVENNRFKNRVKSIVDKSKKIYYKNMFHINRNNIIKTWSTIKLILSKNPSRREPIKKIIYDNIEYINDHEIANIFNNYYSNIALELDQNLPSENETDPCSYLPQNLFSSIYFTPTSPNECNSLINKLKETKQSANHVTVKLIKLVSPYISHVLSDIMNLSFSSGVFPCVLKCSVITPVFKGGNPCDPQNYRPISILPVFSKLLERCIYNRIYKFIINFEIISPCQHGFLKGFSTESAILSLLNFLHDTINNREVSLNIFIDFKKAFDTVNHRILFRKLERYGIRGLPLRLIESYFSDRCQRVRIGGGLSSSTTPSIGVPQGSILGPLLFLLYINDLPNFSNALATILYADDTTLSIRGNSANTIIQNCNQQLNNFDTWAKSNRLTVNTNKTYFMLVTNQRMPDQLPSVSLATSSIEQRTTNKFLGVVLDERLNFGDHVDMLCGKVARSLGILYKLRQYLPLQNLICLYYTFIYPYLVYCNLVWGNTFESHLKPLVILQKKAIRVINGANFNSHTNDLFYSNRILKLKDINIFLQAIYMYKSDTAVFQTSHFYNTRNRNNLNPIFQRTVRTQMSLSFSAPKIWNELPSSIKDLPTLNQFKNKLKDHLIDNYANPDQIAVL